jgi:glycosyltransferase involved in cell wall biosynthesis
MQTRKKVLHLITGLEIGGAEMMLLKILPRLQTDFDNYVCCIRGNGVVGRKLEALGIPVYYLGLDGLFDFRVIKRFKGIIQNVELDLLVTYLIHADIFGRIFGRLFGVKRIISSVRVKLIQPRYLPLLFVDGLTSFLVDHYHFNSKTVADMYQRYFFLPQSKITVIPNGIEIDRYQLSLDISEKRRRLGIPEGIKIIGCVAKLRRQKGHTYLISAFSNIAKERSDVLLLLIGGGAEESKLRQQVARLGLEKSIIFLGNRDDVPELLQLIDVFVLATLFEGMSNALMEAMAAGKAIVTTNIPENAEFILNGKTGLLVPVRDSKGLEKGIVNLLENKERRLRIGKEAFQKTQKDFSLENVVSQYKKLFATFLV